MATCLAIAAIAACGGKDGGGPTDPPVEPVQVPTTLSANANTSLTGTAGVAISPTPTVTLRDAKSAVIAGTMVRFVVAGGGTIANDSSRTDANGVATVGSWTLGRVVGTQTVTASTSGLAPVTFTAQANAGAANKLVSLVTTTQQAVVGSPVPLAPSIRVLDQFDNIVSGAVVTFAVMSGGGTIGGAQKTTGADGIATADRWTFGTVAGAQSVRASVTGVATTVSFAGVATAAAANKVVNLVTTTQQGVVNTAVALAPSVRVTDQFDNPVAGVAVTFAVTAGGGSINGAQKTTGSDGVATADAWILGTATGTQRARADAAGLSTSATFTTVANAGAPTRLTLLAGNNGSGVANTPLESFATLPSVLVTDTFGNPATGVPVIFTPGASSGTVSGSPALTNASGVATITSWILGNVASQTLVATSAQIAGVQVVFSATAQVSSYDITVRYIDVIPSARQQLAVTRAVSKWRGVILGTIGTSRVKLDAQNCGRNWTPAIDENVTNLLILARIGPIDGVGGIVGDAGPCVLHSSNQLTSVGTMMFDSADLATLESSGLIDPVVAHEMGHAIGVGLLWTERFLVADIGTADPIFTGASAAQQFQLLLSGYSGRLTPVENAGGPGSVNAHWRESVFRNELMTSVINSGTNPLSRVTVGSLRDLGYDVSYTGADTYTLSASVAALLSPFGDAAASLSTFSVPMGNDMHVTPLFTADKVGRMTRWTGRRE